MYYFTEYQSALGKLFIVDNGENVVGLWIDEQKYFFYTLSEKPVPSNDSDISRAAKCWLDRYFAGEKPLPSELPLAPVGGEFRQSVWQCLLEIPYGTLTTYGAVAEKVVAKLGKKTMSAQAVGGAVGHNPISIIIPCHRVVGANGNLTGYAGGIDNKIQLLVHEGADMSGLFVPKKSTAL